MAGWRGSGGGECAQGPASFLFHEEGLLRGAQSTAIGEREGWRRPFARCPCQSRLNVFLFVVDARLSHRQRLRAQKFLKFLVSAQHQPRE